MSFTLDAAMLIFLVVNVAAITTWHVQMKMFLHNLEQSVDNLKKEQEILSTKINNGLTNKLFEIEKNMSLLSAQVQRNKEKISQFSNH